MKIALLVSSHIDCEIRVSLLQALLDSIRNAQAYSTKTYNDVETKLFLRLSSTDSYGGLCSRFTDLNSQDAEVGVRQSQFQKIRSELAHVSKWGAQYYVFLDDDDLVSPQLLTSYIKYLKRIDEPLSPQCVVAESEYYVNSQPETCCVKWSDVVSSCGENNLAAAKMDFSGVCVSADMVQEFINLFESEIDSGVGTVDRSFTHRVRTNARYHIQVPTPLVYYRQWNNPRSWKTPAPKSGH